MRPSLCLGAFVSLCSLSISMYFDRSQRFTPTSWDRRKRAPPWEAGFERTPDGRDSISNCSLGVLAPKEQLAQQTVALRATSSQDRAACRNPSSASLWAGLPVSAAPARHRQEFPP